MDSVSVRTRVRAGGIGSDPVALNHSIGCIANEDTLFIARGDDIAIGATRPTNQRTISRVDDRNRARISQRLAARADADVIPSNHRSGGAGSINPNPASVITTDDVPRCDGISTNAILNSR